MIALAALGIVGVSLIWLAMADAAADTKLEQAIAKLKEQGQPTSLADLARKPVPPDENAATYLRRAAAELAAIETIVEAAIDELDESQRTVYYATMEAPESLQQVLQRVFVEHDDAIELLDEAAAQDAFDPQLDYDQSPTAFLEDYLPTMQQVRRPLRVLNYRVAMLLTDGKREEALDTCLTMFKLCRHFDERPLMVAHLVSIAVRGVAVAATNQVLRSGPLPAAAHDRLETELARQDLDAAYMHTLSTERAYGIDTFGDLDAQVRFLGVAANKADLQDYINLFKGLIARADQPNPEVIEWIDSQQTGALTGLLLPATKALLSAKARMTAKLGSLRILNAIARRNLMPGDETPALSELGLPVEVLVDPYNGKEMLVRGDVVDATVYAVGSNLKDDGGRVNEMDDGEFLDVGLGPRND
ncbi:MAG: hypothetical protein DWQ37_12355 [Planctomycetota bacterium]|nr:MAG: hypothetical protein DWQ37_12355 [Planctomycetota bacterium]